MPANAGRAKKAAEPVKNKNKVLQLETRKPENLKPLEDINQDELVFALDIGTRTIVGIAGIQEGSRFKVISTEVVGHKSRAMLDGQIHDIGQVAATVKEVKDKMEARFGFPLKSVAIAAAGRVLKTCQVKVEKDIEPGREIDQETVTSLEIEGIQRAQTMLDEDAAKENKVQFYCVGYSVVNYYLNGYVISRLEGHKGKTIGVDILATFLPHIVVDSLYTVMNKVGLEVTSLTLEPIAAINVTIPPDLRLLNLALVDVGAGTSDIAITRDGSVIAYAMAPTAGDEITESISHHYLVDFYTGEKIKLALSSSKDSINFSDILKKKHSVKVQEVMEVVRPAAELLAGTISQKILEFNHKAPNAVFLIGGGSQLPGLAAMIAECLMLPQDRVVVRGRDVIQNIKFNDKKLSGPESITPYGIAVTAQSQRGKDFLTVTVNDRKIRLFNSKRLTVADALILLGYNPSQLIGRTGRSTAFTINGQKRLVRGEYGKAAEIYVNQSPANLETYIKVGDNIKVIAAQDGKDSVVKVSDIAGSIKTAKVMLNGSLIDISTNISVNGKIAGIDSSIQEGDIVETSEIVTLGDLLSANGISGEESDTLVNGKVAAFEYILKNMDIVEYHRKEQNIPEPDIPESDILTEDSHRVRITVNGKVTILKENKSKHIFVDIFNYIDFDLSKPQGSIVLRLNGHPAAFTDEIMSGDIVEIRWQK